MMPFDCVYVRPHIKCDMTLIVDIKYSNAVYIYCTDLTQRFLMPMEWVQIYSDQKDIINVQVTLEKLHGQKGQFSVLNSVEIYTDQAAFYWSAPGIHMTNWTPLRNLGGEIFQHSRSCGVLLKWLDFTIVNDGKCAPLHFTYSIACEHFRYFFISSSIYTFMSTKEREK